MKIDQRGEKIGFIRAISDFFKGYVDFSGYSTRSGYWWIQLFLFIVEFLIGMFFFSQLFPALVSIIPYMDGATDEQAFQAMIYIFQSMSFGFIISSIWSLAIFLPRMALNIRRLRDVGFSNLAIWLYYLCPLGLILTVVADSILSILLAPFFHNGVIIITIIYWLLLIAFAILIIVSRFLKTDTFCQYSQDSFISFLFRDYDYKDDNDEVDWIIE